MKDISILFVCMGNICRSPTAEGVFRSFIDARKNDLDLKSKNIIVDSAGTIAYHIGEAPDTRSISAADKRGYDLCSIVSRKIADNDFIKFDLILAMDEDNYSDLVAQANKTVGLGYIKKIKLFLDFSQQADYKSVPDPYYGGNYGFDLVIDLIEDASLGLLEHIKQLD